MFNKTLEIDGVQVPRFLYCTAWKEERTQTLVELALEQGFRGIDTANQRKHYYEAAVGAGIAAAIERGLVRRDELFLQTKFTFLPGQDHRLPYDADAPIQQQVAQSFASSLEHLGVNSIDSYVLHGPSRRYGLGDADREAWRAMEELHASGRVRLLGVSNVTLEQLAELYDGARVKPRFVQNRCFAATRWDRDVRDFCAGHAVTYQGFSLLTANRAALGRRELADIAQRHGRTLAQVVFRFALEVGMIPLTGTTNPEHMRADLAAYDFSLSQREVELIENFAAF